ncbi:MAG: NUDIX domain-containing protein [Candidatus Nezhaarchaeales archaeon]|nr:MAG: NUDIX hydrolase [Thermoprotei archaeon]
MKSSITNRPRPALAVDAVIIRKNGNIILVKRRRPPYEGHWALPGGFVEYGETVEDAVKREVKEETGLDVEIKGLIGVYSKPDRDPRGHVVSIAYLVTEIGGELRGSEETDIGEFSVIPDKLAFDHNDILRDGLNLAKKMGINVNIDVK